MRLPAVDPHTTSTPTLRTLCSPISLAWMRNHWCVIQIVFERARAEPRLVTEHTKTRPAQNPAFSVSVCALLIPQPTSTPYSGHHYITHTTAMDVHTSGVCCVSSDSTGVHFSREKNTPKNMLRLYALARC